MRPRQAHNGIVALLPLLIALACSRAGELPSAHEVTGDYEYDHRVWVFHGNEPVEVEVADRLLLTAVDETTLRFRLEHFALDGEECLLEGLAKRRRDHFAYAVPRASASCELRLRPQDESIVVTDVESRCSRMRCGESGAIGQMAFGRVEREE